MRILLLTFAVLAAIRVTPAAAADPGEPVDVAPVVFDWSGFYAGVLAGYGWSDTEHCDASASPPCRPEFPSHENDGWLAGVTAGYNFQFANSVVLGLEADYAAADIEGSNPGGNGFSCNGHCYAEIDAIGTIRARMGYAIDNFLPYVTGGVAFTRETAGMGDPTQAERTEWETSGTVGAGLEYALTAHVSAKVDYLHIFTESELNYGLCGVLGCYGQSEGVDLVRAGLNFRF